VDIYPAISDESWYALRHLDDDMTDEALRQLTEALARTSSALLPPDAPESPESTSAK
jgi:hypothetical protein